MKGLFSQIFGRQLARPGGWIGILVGKLMRAGNQDMYASALKALRLTRGDTLLEIGFGNGDQIGDILSEITPGNYFGLEISETMLRQAERKNKKAVRDGNVILNKGGQENLPFPAGFIDKVLTVNTIYFWEHPETMMAEICTVLKSGARVVVTFNSKAFLQNKAYAKERFRLYEENEVLRLMEKSGFVKIRAHYEQLRHQDAWSVVGEKP